jgi:hypothetical protein
VEYFSIFGVFVYSTGSRDKCCYFTSGITLEIIGDTEHGQHNIGDNLDYMDKTQGSLAF